MTLTQAELLAVQAHESEHDARHHGTRRNGRDPIKWNEACDYAINIDLVDQGFVLPKGALLDGKYRGMSAEDIYRSRELDEAAKQQQQQSEPDDETEPDNEQGDSDDGGNGTDGTEVDDKSADESVEEPDQIESDGDGQEDDMDGEQGDTGGGSDDGDKPSDDSMSGGAGNGDQDAPAHLEPQPHKICGEILDAADDASEVADQDITWERITREAASLAAAVGQLPGHITREIQRANDPPRNWRDELREFCEQGVASH